MEWSRKGRTVNTRQRHELRLLAERGEFDLEKVAADFGVSVRSIRYDIDDLNVLLLDLSRDDAIVVRQKAAQLQRDVPRRKIMELSFARGRDYNVSPLSTQERVLLSVFTLCWLDDFITVQSLADDYQVSRVTVSRDLQKVREYCEAHGIAFEGNRGKGVRIVADEKTRRRVIAQVLRDYGTTVGLHSGLEVADYLKWFSEQELRSIEDIVREAEAQAGLYLDDVAFEAMVVHIALSIKRSETQMGMPTAPMAAGTLDVGSLQYQMADHIVRQVESVFGVSLPEAEHYYIEVHIGARSSEAAASSTRDAVIEFMCMSTIAEVSRELGVDLTHDTHLYDRLLRHVLGSVYRKQAGLLLENPLRDELLEGYAEHAAIVRRALDDNGLSQLMEITDDEVTYVLLHFEAALVGDGSERMRHANVVVVCSTGVGTAELLAAELRRSFDVNIIANVPSHRARGLVGDVGIDLVVSTVELDVSVPCVVVRPIPREDDMDRIACALRELGFSGDVDLPPLRDLGAGARKVARILRHNPGRNQEAQLMSELRSLLEKRDWIGQERSYMLSELLEGGHVVLDAECETWQEAVRASGMPLVATGDITEEYIDAVIANIEEAGPYVVITKHVALPHATNRVGVNETAMSCVRLRTPVEFGSAENDPVKYEFMLATVDATSHLQALMSLVGLLRTQEFLDLLATATHGDEIVSYVREFENKTSEKNG
ncbi:MAG TPA: PTS sugar transporter subunit IIA [Candidatus Olsenella excrementigallinarum]|nr:PTS sugar transporter subunit IIA [Candidatus Olsenella excrementigallinarum]